MDEPKMLNFAPPTPSGTAPTEEVKSAPTEEPKSTEVKADSKEEVDDGEEPSEEGLTPMHIDMVMQNAHCSRREAVKALRDTNNDMVSAIIALTK